MRHESWLDCVETGKPCDFVISLPRPRTQEEATSPNLHWVQKGALWKMIRLLDTAGVQAVPSWLIDIDWLTARKGEVPEWVQRKSLQEGESPAKVGKKTTKKTPKTCGNISHSTYMYHIIMLYTWNLHNVICQLDVSKAGKYLSGRKLSVMLRIGGR